MKQKAAQCIPVNAPKNEADLIVLYKYFNGLPLNFLIKTNKKVFNVAYNLNANLN